MLSQLRICIIILSFLIANNVAFTEDSIVFVEGENAIVTNFAKEPIFNFSCSNLLSLQLNKRTESNSELKYFADYIINVPSSGTYELWIAGTPPGYASSRLPSYFSPYELQVDNDKAFDIYFEDVEIKEKYASSYYWVKISKINLSPGPHTIKFIIKARRNFDNLYYFYLDAFFLIKMNQQKEYIFPEKLPDFFPKDIAGNKKITFKTPEDYLNMLKDDPNNYDILDMLAELYTITYQYNESIKYLKTASLLQPDNVDIKRLIAQNYLWKGDYNSGIAVYNSILKEQQKNLSLYKETAKITSWFGIYKEAIKIYDNAISLFPDDLELKINLALTYFWDTKSDKANEILKSIEVKGQKNPEILISAGDILAKNRYYDLAILFYNYAINLKSDNPRPYFESANLNKILGNNEMAIDALNKLKSVYSNTEEYDKILSEYSSKNFLRNEFTKQLEEKLKNNPEEYETLILLAEVYAWQHNDKKAIDQYLKIIENKTFNAVEDLETDNYSITNTLAVNNIYKGMMDTYYKEYQSYIAIIEKIISNIAKFQTNTDEYNNELKNLQVQLNKLENIINIFNKINENIQKSSNKINDKIASIKLSDAIYKAQKKELKWELSNDEYKKIFENNYKTLNSYFSLKILGIIYYYEDDIKYKDTIYKLYNNFPDYKKTKYEYFLYLANNNKLDEVKGYLESNQFSIIPYNQEIQSVFNEINSYTINSDDSYLLVNDINLLTDRWNKLKMQSDSINNYLKDNNSIIYKNINLMKSYLNNELEKKLFYFEKDISGLRLEVGEYYSNIKEYEKAEYEFNNVIKVDNENLDVKYLLAKNYQVMGNWYKAMKLYKEVYGKDPRNTLSASLYNQIADLNPISFSSLSKVYSEGNNSIKQTLTIINESIETNLFINRYISFDLYANFNNFLINNFSVNYRFNNLYFKNEFHFEIPKTGLIISPGIGIDIFNTFQVNSINNSFSNDQNVYINNSFVYPYFDFNIEWKKISYFNISFLYIFQIFKNSVILGINGYYFSNQKSLNASDYNSQYQVYLTKQNFILNLNYNFAFTRIYPFTKISMSTKGDWEIYSLSDIKSVFNFSLSPEKYTLNQDLYFNFAEISKAGLNFYFISLFIYEGSDRDFYQDYLTNNNDKKYIEIYTPRQIISFKNGLKLKLDTSNFSKLPLTFSTQIFIGPQWQNAGETPLFLLFNIDNALEFWFKKITLVFEFNYSLSYDLNSDNEKKNHFQSFNGSIYVKVPIHQNITY